MQIKKIISILCVITLILGISGCGKAKTPETAVSSYLSALKNADQKKAEQYGSYQDMVNALQIPQLSPDKATEKKLMKTVFHYASWKIEGTLEDKKYKYVKVKLQTLNMREIFMTAFTDIYSYEKKQAKQKVNILNNPDKIKACYQIYLDTIEQKKDNTLSTTIYLKLPKDQKKGWKITMNESTINYLSGNLYINAASIVQQATNGIKN